MGRALYRTYRSRSLDEVVGQEHVTDLLKNALKNGRISHAYLLTGPRGVGKTSVARIIAHEINQIPYSEDPKLDIIEIDAASNRRIDDIRDLREKVHIAPVSAKYKVYIIDEVHMLTGESFNALLKTLEEPPEHVVFILATTELHKVPATIISRTQRFHFRPVAHSKVIQHLQFIAKKEKIEIDDNALDIIAEHGGGSFRDSISLLDQLANLADHITKPLVESVLGRASSERVESLIAAIATNDSEAIRSILVECEQEGIAAPTLAEQLLRTLLAEKREGAHWYQIADGLMDISKAHFPYLKLMTLLLGSYQIETVVSPIKTSPAAPKPLIEKPEPHQPAEQKAEVPVPAPEPKKESAKSTKPTGEFNWDTVLDAAQKHDPPLNSIISRAKASYANETLSLDFQYTLHRTKMKQAAYQNKLSSLIREVCGLSPNIHVTEPGEVNIAEDKTTKAVADIMGGGEVVEP